MSNPERRAQVRIEPKVSTPLNTRPAESWDDLQEGWDVPTVVDSKEKQATPETGDTHDAAAILARARAAVADPRLGDKVVGQAYAAEEAAARVAQVGAIVDLANDEPDPAKAFPDDTDAGPISLPGEPEADQADLPTEEIFPPSFGTGDSLTEDAPFSLDNRAKPFLVQGRSPWDPVVGDFGENAVASRAPHPVIVERSSSRGLSMPEPTTVQAPVVPGSIGDVANMTRPSITPRGETLVIANAPETQRSNSWLSRTAQAVVGTVKRWSSRLAIIGSLFAQPEPQKPITVPQPAPPVPEQIVPAPQPVEAQAPLVTNGTPPENLPVSPVAEESRVQTTVTPASAVADVTPPRVSVHLPDFGTPQRPPVQKRDAEPAKPRYQNTTADGRTYNSDTPLVPSVVGPLDYGISVPAPVTAEPTPATPPAPVVDTPQPVADSMSAVQQPPSAVEVSKQLNVDLGKGVLSPEKQIEYIKNLFDTLDTSKIFIRLSPTKRLELRQSASGDIAARFPGEKDFRALTAEEVKGLGDLTKKPHYSR